MAKIDSCITSFIDVSFAFQWVYISQLVINSYGEKCTSEWHQSNRFSVTNKAFQNQTKSNRFSLTSRICLASPLFSFKLKTAHDKYVIRHLSAKYRVIF